MWKTGYHLHNYHGNMVRSGEECVLDVARIMDIFEQKKNVRHQLNVILIMSQNMLWHCSCCRDILEELCEIEWSIVNCIGCCLIDGCRHNKWDRSSEYSR